MVLGGGLRGVLNIHTSDAAAEAVLGTLDVLRSFISRTAVHLARTIGKERDRPLPFRHA